MVIPAGSADAQTPPSAGIAPADAPFGLSALQVPGGTAGLLRAGDAPPSPRAAALQTLLRSLYVRVHPAGDAQRRQDAIRSYFESASKSSSSSDAETVPLPLSADIWLRAVFRGTVAPDRLLQAIVTDRSAAYLYLGLLSLDDATLAFFGSHPALLSAIREQAPAVFAKYGRSIHISHDKVVLPGGDAAVPLWEAVVGERATSPEHFVLGVLRRDEGRAAYFLDAVTHLDASRQSFALGPDRRVERFRALYAAIVGFESATWKVNLWAFTRPADDPGFLLMQVAASADGRMAPPGDRAFWQAVFDGRFSRCSEAAAGQSADASWLVERLAAADAGARRVLLDEVLFAQRVFGKAAPADRMAACEVTASFPRYEGLLLTLEHMGVSAPRDYLDAVRVAAAIDESHKRTGVVRVAQVQGLVAVLDRVSSTSDAGRRTAQQLVRSFLSLAVGAGGLRAGQVRDWIGRVFVPAVCGGRDSFDACVEAAVTGSALGERARPVVEWENQRYRVDIAAGLLTRLVRVRESQQGIRFDEALAVTDIGLAVRNEPFSAVSARQQATRLREVASGLTLDGHTLFGAETPSVESLLDGAARRLASAQKNSPTAASEILEAGDILLAHAFASFAYAMAVGDPDASLLLAGDPAERHDFGDWRAAPVTPWQLCRELRSAAGLFIMHGSLFGLDRACAGTAIRRLSAEAADRQPTLQDSDFHAFPESVAAFNPLALSDESREAIVSAIRRGRTAVVALARDPAALAQRASEVGVSEWRYRTAIWLAHDAPDAVVDLFSLAELLWFGNPGAPRASLDAWGVPVARLDGSLAVEMPRGRCWEDFSGRAAGLLPTQMADLHLRVAEWLDTVQLPAVLAAGITAFATWDLMTSARLADVDDWFGLARAADAVPGDRLVDYVSALTVDGPLVPIPE